MVSGFYGSCFDDFHGLKGPRVHVDTALHHLQEFDYHPNRLRRTLDFEGTQVDTDNSYELLFNDN